MTEEAIQSQIEAIERLGEEFRKNPEMALAYIKEMHEFLGIPLKFKKKSRSKKKKNARLSAV